jgi:hypothetical protein
MHKLISPIFLSIALVAVAAGCGGGRIPCDAADLPDSSVSLVPESVQSGTEVSVVVSFDEPLFDQDAGYGLPFQNVVVVDGATDEWIGTFSDDWLDYEWSQDPHVSGVVLDGEVLDGFSIELVLELPNDLVDGAIVQLEASDIDPHCLLAVSGEARLAVESIQ